MESVSLEYILLSYQACPARSNGTCDFFRFPVFFDNHELYELDWYNENTVERIVELCYNSG